MRKMMVWLMLLLLLLPSLALAGEEESTVYGIVTEQGQRITSLASVPDVGDEYIAGNNQHFRVMAVDHTRQEARAQLLGVYTLPDVSWLSGEAEPVSGKRRAIAMYCTHSDESYKPDDGTHSDEKRGGIYDVAEALKGALEKKGITVYYSDETHFPHDAGAYRRSRATAASLMEEGVDAILDIHRDGIPNPDEYKSKVEGDNVTKVRLLVGRSNQNAAANKQFAVQLKAVADKLYPGLIKDIYMGKGSYNQDLMGQAVLLEFGTFTSDKDSVLQSTGYMADVMNRTLYGGVTGAAGSKTGNQAPAQPAPPENSGAWSGIGWVIGIFVVGLLIFAFLSTGSGKEAMHKWKRSFQEMSGGLFGGKHEKKDGPHDPSSPEA